MRQRYLYRLAYAMGEEDVEALAERITPEQLDRWIDSGALSLPEQLALLGVGVCRSFGNRHITTDCFYPWHNVIELSEAAFIANFNQSYGVT